MKQSNPIENMNKEQLEEPAEILEDDLANMLPDDVDWSGSRSFYEQTLRRVRVRLTELGKDGSHVPQNRSLTNDEKSV